MRIRDKVKKPRRPVVSYEILPPREKDGTLNSYAETISSLLSQTHIDAINIPEVRDEEGRGDRPIKNQVRAEPREFGQLLQDIVGIEAIINRVVVHKTLDEQMEWFEETNKIYEIENVIIVGGESGEIDYPGPSVNEALSQISTGFNSNGGDIFCGGITIPSRSNEPERIIKKSENGSEFFTTQVLYESSKVINMISQYQEQCKELSTFPRRILLSFAPVSSQKNIEFLKWLGVEIPENTERYLNGRPGSMTDRSLDVAIEILNDTLNYIIDKKLTVPIGLNVEHIMSYNFQSSVEMLQELARIYREFCIKSDIY
ncbi:MAG: methylenetetrahydrofolate reductase [Candidatus Marinimicrobia bacterium]|jgi:5,10-methylenetetrahydrofolate reductase|nr:methylenetetrahydrofolate reductase [Candidatus Neomarinimicrobiota bacterium]